MYKKSLIPFVWILDNNLNYSVQYLPNKYLISTIQHLISCLISTRYYYYGIRTPAIFKYKFSKEHKEETISDLFPNENPNDIIGMHKFSFSNYANKTAKWSRKCREHYQTFVNYLGVCITEEYFRFGKLKKSHEIGIILTKNDGFENKIPLGNLSNIIFEWKCLPVKYRCKDVVEGYKKLFLSKIENPFEEYAMSKRDIPDFVMEKFKLEN